MPATFIDHTARRLFIEGLIEVISEIFQISDDVTKSSLYNELTVLDDNELVSKQKLIEDYYDHVLAASKEYLQDLQLVSNQVKEGNERNSITTPIIY